MKKSELVRKHWKELYKGCTTLSIYLTILRQYLKSSADFNYLDRINLLSAEFYDDELLTFCTDSRTRSFLPSIPLIFSMSVYSIFIFIQAQRSSTELVIYSPTVGQAVDFQVYAAIMEKFPKSNTARSAPRVEGKMRSARITRSPNIFKLSK